MTAQKIDRIKKIAHEIDIRINLFEGYSPKILDSKKDEVLFWRQVVNIYGLFADCDRVQIKENNNLIDLLKRYDLIERSEYDNILDFWKDISELRKWFCHNNDETLFYSNERKKKISEYLRRAFVIASKKPSTIDDIQQNEWDILNFDIESRFENYLNILEKALVAWKTSDEKVELVEGWIEIQAKALAAHRELIQNVLAEMAEYERINNGICNVSVRQLAMLYYKQLEAGKFSASDIADIMNNEMDVCKTNKEIVLDAVRKSGLI